MSSPPLLRSLFLIAWLSGAAAVARPQSSDEAECRAAAAKYMDAFDAGDAAVLRQVIYYDPEINAQKLAVQGMIDCVVAQRAFDAAVAARWGPGAARYAIDPTRFTAAEHAALPQARFELRGVTDAILVTRGNVAPIVLRRTSSEGAWRVVVRGITAMYDTPRSRRPEANSRRRIKAMEDVEKALRAVTARVAAGAFPNADAAVNALQAAFDDAAD
jgi:hypothetical protein